MDEVGELRRKAETCRRLADIEASDEDKMLWLERAADWERLAIEADKRGDIVARRRAPSFRIWNFTRTKLL
jgi:hypothetical protein